MTSARRASADVVIVGAGSAGCVVAEKLSRDPGREVVLLEAGPVDWPDAAVRDLRRLPIEQGSPYVRHHAEGHGHLVVRGAGFGGSAAVNGGYFLRGHRSDFADWPAGWLLDDIEAAYSELDGPTGTMAVTVPTDDEIGDAATAFETYWGGRVPTRDPADRWPIIGVNRVPTNAVGGLRTTTAETYLRPALTRPNLRVRAGTPVAELCIADGRVTGLRLGDEMMAAGEVILSAGTLGTAAILLRSGLAADGAVSVAEHATLSVGYRRRRPAPPGSLLPSVVHTADRLEIRCYRDDFASYVRALPPRGPLVEVAAMTDSPGRVRWADGRLQVDFAGVRADIRRDLDRAAAEVTDMLAGSDFAAVVEPGSIRCADRTGVSQHAWGSMPMGQRTGPLGEVDGIRGLRIVDASILPDGGRSGPHATVLMVACHIGEALASGG